MSIKSYLDSKTAKRAGFLWSDKETLSLRRKDGTVCPVYFGRDEVRGLNLAIIEVPASNGTELYFARLAGKPPEQLPSYQRLMIELDGSINETNKIKSAKQLRKRLSSHVKANMGKSKGARFHDNEAEKDWYHMPNDSADH